MTNAPNTPARHAGSPDGMPLSAYPAHRSADLDHTREWMHGVGDRPTRLTQADATPTSIAFNAGGLRGITFTFDSYGMSLRADVERYSIDPYLVFLPIAGRSRIRLGNLETMTIPNLAAVISAPGPLCLEYDGGTRTMQVRIERELLETRLRKMLGGVAPKSFDFDMVMDVRAPAAATWRSLVDVAVADLDAGGTIASSPLAAASIENAIVDALLVGQGHNFSEKLEQTGPTPRPRLIQRAVNLIHDHCHEPLSTADIAEAVGLSARALQEGFQAHVGTTPMAYLRRIRLQRIRADLRAADPATTNVTRVALEWGMTHLGRFAQSYRVEFGESPSETLRLGS